MSDGGSVIGGFIVIVIIAFLTLYGMINFIDHTFGNGKTIDIKLTNKKTWQLDDTTFKTYSCVRVQKVVR